MGQYAEGDEVASDNEVHLCVTALHEVAHYSRMKAVGIMTDTSLRFGDGVELERRINHGRRIVVRRGPVEQALRQWDGKAAWPLKAQPGPVEPQVVG